MRTVFTAGFIGVDFDCLKGYLISPCLHNMRVSDVEQLADEVLSNSFDLLPTVGTTQELEFFLM